MKSTAHNLSTILEAGVQEIVSDAELSKLLQSGRPLKVKLGVDPTSRDLHLGHAVVLEKLRQFQEAGHNTYLIIGDFTASIGDPAGVNKTRPILTPQEIKDNMQTYLDQAKQIIDLKKTQIRYNSGWLESMTLRQFLGYAELVNVGSLLEREDFSARLGANQPVGLHEFIYPLAQGIDSAQLEIDVEIGGWDQRLNLLMARELQKKLGQKPEQLVLLKALIGLDGTQKMSSSKGNYISLTASPDQMFGQVMSVPDKLILNYGELAAGMTGEELEHLASLHPREAKAQVAEKIVARYHGLDLAKVARERFNQTFGKATVAADLVEKMTMTKCDLTLAETVSQVAGVSQSEARRLIAQRGVKVNQQVAIEPKTPLNFQQPIHLQIGKHRFFQLECN